MVSGTFTFAVLGAGARGQEFSQWLCEHPSAGRVVAVAEPDRERRQLIAEAHQIPMARQHASWEELLARPRLADAVINTLMDRLHAPSALAALKLGYHMLLEKPMAATLEDCVAIDRMRQATGRIVSVCHSLRHHVLYVQVKRLLADGAIGRLVSFDQLEPVSPLHYAHSFVRGNWSNEARSNFVLMTKCCHDVDVLAYLVGQPCWRVSSFGCLTYFRQANAPKGAPDRCTDGCPAEAACPYAVQKVYLPQEAFWGKFLWTQIAAGIATPEDRWRYLRTSPYGRCVFHSDNDVVDHQVVNFEFADGVTGTFTMTAFAQPMGRRSLRLHGTHGEIRATLDTNTIALQRFADGAQVQYALPIQSGSHMGGDNNLMNNFMQALRANDPNLVLTTTTESLASHKIVFAAEQARREGRVVALNELDATTNCPGSEAEC